MGRLLYIFPHPDDESFGPSPAMVRQLSQGHEVHLLTLTHGEATKVRARWGLSLAEMARRRRAEMQAMAAALGLTSLSVLDYPDGGLAAVDPLLLEETVEAHLDSRQPHVVVTYPVHGVSGHPDHLVAHAVVKRAVAARRRAEGGRPRLAFFTLPPDEAPGRPAHLKSSPWEAIGCVEPVSEADLAQAAAALDCYTTYQEVVAAHRPLEQVRGGVCFELFQEQPATPYSSLMAGLPGAT